MLKYITLTIAISTLFISNLLAQNPSVMNVTFTQRTDGSHIVDIYYDVQNPTGNPMIVTMEVSDNNGVTWDYPCSQIIGEVGSGINSGTNKHIIWNFSLEHPNVFDDQYRVKIIASDIGGGTPCAGVPTVNYEGKTYNTIQIGDQCWLRENLNVGVMLQGNQNQTDNSIIEKYCYDNDQSNCNIYGGLYQWNEAMQYMSNYYAQGICPAGWHIPGVDELDSLAAYVNSDGNALKAIGQGTGSGTGTNTSGFSALLAGASIYSINSFEGLGINTIFWSSVKPPAVNNPYAIFLFGDVNNIQIEQGCSIGEVCGFSIRCIKDESQSGQPCPGIPTIIYEGKTYNTVLIGDQCWLKENIDVGVMIQGSQNATDNGVIEKYCYNDNPNNCSTYGGLYQWNEAMQYTTTPGTQGICPPGWHIPTLGEFQTLAAAVGNDGNALKAIGQGSGSGAGTNTSGFSALLAGYRNYLGYFFSLGVDADFWSSTEDNASIAYILDLIYNNSEVYLGYGNKGNGFSVRCLKD
jgi:uncharacterized protein (TIGR02145 family)